MATLDTRRPFLRRDGLAAGVSRRRLDSAAYRRIGRGILVAADVPDSPRLRVEAALVPFPDSAFASHASAARIWQAPIPTLVDEHVTVVDPAHRRQRPHLRCHVRADSAVVLVDRVRVTALPDLFVEMVTQLDLVELVVLGDWMVRRKRVTPARLRTAAAAATGEVGRRAREAAAFVREKVDSPMETRLRMLLVLAGVPEPVVNLEIRDADGEVLRRHDLAWPGARVVVEYDGRHHIAREDQWESDLARREASETDGWRMVVVVARGIYSEPGNTLQRVWDALRQRGLADLPDGPLDGWQAHFPGHGPTT